jgi:hypothetical protein
MNDSIESQVNGNSLLTKSYMIAMLILVTLITIALITFMML